MKFGGSCFLVLDRKTLSALRELQVKETFYLIINLKKESKMKEDKTVTALQDLADDFLLKGQIKATRRAIEIAAATEDTVEIIISLYGEIDRLEKESNDRI